MEDLYNNLMKKLSKAKENKEQRDLAIVEKRTKACKDMMSNKYNILKKFNDDILKAVKLEITKIKRRNMGKTVLGLTVAGTVAIAGSYVSRKVRKNLTKVAVTGLAMALGVDVFDRISDNKSEKEDEHSGCNSNKVIKNQDCDSNKKNDLQCINKPNSLTRDI